MDVQVATQTNWETSAGALGRVHFLFLTTMADLGNGLSGEGVGKVGRAGFFWEIRSGALSMALENSGERNSLTLGRTHNRSRSPR